MSPDLKELLKKRNYITRITKDGDGCIIQFPHPKLTHRGSELVEYVQFQRKQETGLNVYTSLDTNNKRFIPMPEYVFRFFIMCEIWCLHIEWDLPLDLVVYLDESKNEFNDIENIIKEPTNTEDVQKEKFLKTLCLEAYKDNFPKEYRQVAITHGIDAGYQTILKFFDKSEDE